MAGLASIAPPYFRPGLLQSTVNVRPLIFLLAVNDANHDYPFSTRKTVNWNEAILCYLRGNLKLYEKLPDKR